MRRSLARIAVLFLALPALLGAAPNGGAPRPDPNRVPALPSHIERVAPAIVGIHVEVPPDRPSVATLGAERWGSGVVFDQAGYALTVSYVLLDAGSALGRGCGPLLISKRTIASEDVAAGNLSIAIPGKYTTANFLLGLAFPAARNKTELVFSSIEPALQDELYDAGLIIHENRFTYEANGLRKVIDLGEFWERETGAPIPLGGIAINRSLPDEAKHSVNRVVRRSVEYAFAHRAASLPFVREHAQEMSEDVMYRHIDLYVNEYSVDLGKDGRRAVEILFEKARATGMIPEVKDDLFLRRP